MYADTSRRSTFKPYAYQEQGADQQVLEHMKNALRVVVEWQAPAVSLDRKRASVRATLEGFCQHLERLMEFEEQGGYLSVVADTRPNWHERVNQLREDHQELRQRIEHIVPQFAETISWDVETFGQTCSEISELLDRVDHHDRNEIALLQETMLNEEGGEG